jgi:hypothetical protein
MWPFKSTTYTAFSVTNEFVETVELEHDWEGEPSHSLSIRFIEPVRDGNQVSHINVIYDGRAFVSEGLVTGETKYRFGLNPEEAEFEVVFANDDDEVLMTDRIRIEVAED